MAVVCGAAPQRLVRSSAVQSPDWMKLAQSKGWRRGLRASMRDGWHEISVRVPRESGYGVRARRGYVSRVR